MWAQYAGRAVGFYFFLLNFSLLLLLPWLESNPGRASSAPAARVRVVAEPWLPPEQLCESWEQSGLKHSPGEARRRAGHTWDGSSQRVSPPALPAVVWGCLHPEQRGTSRRIHICPQVFSPALSSKGSSRASKNFAVSADAFHIKAGQARIVWEMSGLGKLKRRWELQNRL